MTADIEWKLPLLTPPELVGMGLATYDIEGTREYCLPELWSMHLHEYEARIHLPDHGWLEVHPGSVSVVPANTFQRYYYQGESSHIFTHYKPSGSGETVPVPAIVDMGEQFPVLWERAMDAVRVFASSPLRCEAFVWDSLWMLAQRLRENRGRPVPDQPHPGLAIALSYVETHLNQPITVEDIVCVSGLSQSHLLRLFRHYKGCSIIGYVRKRRAELGRHLLVNTTLPIKAAAVDVGLSDLQQFNKLIRQFWGQSPRALRQANRG